MITAREFIIDYIEGNQDDMEDYFTCFHEEEDGGINQQVYTDSICEFKSALSRILLELKSKDYSDDFCSHCGFLNCTNEND